MPNLYDNPIIRAGFHFCTVPGSASTPAAGAAAPVSGASSGVGMPRATNGGASSGSNIINSALPGAPGLTASASGMVDRLLNGLPSTSSARKSNAVFGVNSGLAPGSEFLKTRLFDTYGQQVEERNQRGLDDFLALLSGTTGPALAQNAQSQQASQFSQSLAQQQAEFAARLKQQQEQFNAEHDLALQQFGFNRSRYYSGNNSPSGANNNGLTLYPNSVVSQSWLEN